MTALPSSSPSPDTTAPDAVTSWATYPTGPVATTATAITLTGAHVENGAIVRIFGASTCTTALATATVASGILSATASGLSEGAYGFYYTVADSTGNVRACAETGTAVVTIDTAAPSAVTGWTSSPSNSAVTSVVTPTLSGTAGEVGALVRIFSASDCLTGGVGSAYSAGGGSVSVTTSALADGIWNFYYTIADGLSNTRACASAGLSLTVVTSAPTSIAYSSPSVTYVRGAAITSNTVTATGGFALTYLIAPVLPADLGLNGSTGTISGTASDPLPLTVFVVTASNGFGSATTSVTMEVPAPMTGPNPVAVGNNHSCAIMAGKPVCWGQNDFGQLGDNSTTNRTTPVRVEGLAANDVVTALALGATHTCAIISGAVKCWGGNTYGQLGNNSTISSPWLVPVGGVTSGAQDLTAGDAHTCALVNGGVKCWGLNSDSQLGSNSTTNSAIPVDGFSLGNGVQAVAAGANFSFAIVNGALFGWGKNEGGQLGINNNGPTAPVSAQVYGLTGGVQAVAAGGSSACAIVNGGAKCWGRNTVGQLGNNSTTDSVVPVTVSGQTVGGQKISVGGQTACLISNGGLRCWGAGTSGNLGNAGATDSHVAAGVVLNLGATEIGVGDNHACAVAAGAASCWGNNLNGQLGNNSITKRLIPVSVTGLTTAVLTGSVGVGHA